MNEDIKGKFITRTKENGIKYKLYVPENVNANTPVFTYAYGSGDPGIEKCVLEKGTDSIFIMTIVDYNRDIDNITMNIVDEVKQEFGVTSTIVTPSGFSLGGPVGYMTAAENIRRNPGGEQQTVFLVDAYGTYFYNPKLHLNDQETINLFKENNTVFFALDHPLKKEDVNTLYAKAGLNLIMVKCIGQGHGDINASFFNEKMYDYMAGQALPKDGYAYYKFNIDTDSWEEVPYEKIATKDDLNSYLGIDTFSSNIKRLSNLSDITVKSDDKTLENYMNSIRNSIRNTNFLGANFDTSFASTTQVPNAIPDLIYDYFNMTSSLLNKIANKTTAIANIALEIDSLDKQMEKEAELVNSSNLSETLIQPELLTVTNTNNKGNSDKDLNSNLDSSNIVKSTGVKEIKSINNQFPKYEELYTTNNRVVYNCNDKYKVVIYHENGNITGIEYYYDYKTMQEATNAIKQLNIDYKNIDNFDRIIQNDRYVKVLFKEEMYKGLTLDYFKEKFKDLEQL